MAAPEMRPCRKTDTSRRRYTAEVVSEPMNPIQLVQYSGTHKRVEYLEACILKEHLDNGTPTNEKMRDRVKDQLGGLNTDHAGHIIATR